MSEKKFWYKIEDSLYDEKEELGEDLRRIRSHVHNEIEEEKEEKYKQLEFEFKAEDIYQKYVNQNIPCELFLNGQLQKEYKPLI